MGRGGCGDRERSGFGDRVRCGSGASGRRCRE